MRLGARVRFTTKWLDQLTGHSRERASQRKGTVINRTEKAYIHVKLDGNKTSTRYHHSFFELISDEETVDEDRTIMSQREKIIEIIASRFAADHRDMGIVGEAADSILALDQTEHLRRMAQARAVHWGKVAELSDYHGGKDQYEMVASQFQHLADELAALERS